MAGRNPAEGVRGGRGRAWGEGLSRRIPRLHLYCINSIDGARSLNWWLVISRTITLRLDEDVYQRFHIVGRARQPPTPTSSKTRSCATWSDPVAAILCARAGGASFCCSGGAPLSGLVQSPDSRKQRSRSVGRSSSTICGRPAARPGGGGGVEIRRSRPARSATAMRVAAALSAWAL